MKSKFIFPTSRNLFFSTAIAATVSMMWQASAANLTWDITPGIHGNPND